MLLHIPFYACLVGLNVVDNKPSTLAHVLVYGAIEAHSMGSRGCIASNKTISKEIGLSEERTRHIIGELNRGNWIKVTLNDNNQRTLIEPLARVVIDSQGGGYRRPGGVATDDHIEYSNKNTVEISNTNKKNSLIMKDPIVGIAQEFWVSTFGRDRTFTKPDDAACTRLIKEYGITKVKNYIVLARAGRADQYAPVITNFRELESKWERLEAWGMRTQNKRLNRSVTITE